MSGVGDWRGPYWRAYRQPSELHTTADLEAWADQLGWHYGARRARIILMGYDQRTNIDIERWRGLGWRPRRGRR
jgi:hypothetical protein